MSATTTTRPRTARSSRPAPKPEISRGTRYRLLDEDLHPLIDDDMADLPGLEPALLDYEIAAETFLSAYHAALARYHAEKKAERQQPARRRTA